MAPICRTDAASGAAHPRTKTTHFALRADSICSIEQVPSSMGSRRLCVCACARACFFYFFRSPRGASFNLIAGHGDKDETFAREEEEPLGGGRAGARTRTRPRTHRSHFFSRPTALCDNELRTTSSATTRALLLNYWPSGRRRKGTCSAGHWSHIINKRSCCLPPSSEPSGVGRSGSSAHSLGDVFAHQLGCALEQSRVAHPRAAFCALVHFRCQPSKTNTCVRASPGPKPGSLDGASCNFMSIYIDRNALALHQRGARGAKPARCLRCRLLGGH